VTDAVADPLATERSAAWTWRWRRPWTPLNWLVLFVVLYTVVSVTLSDLRRLEFLTTNWDLGIFQQALWSAGHGYPFFEVGDYETYGSPSILLVHPAFVLFVLVPLYAAVPSALTLFVVQSVAVAGAAFPLYAIGLEILKRPRRALLPPILYLVWAPLLASNLYDFHLEAFLPLELFALFWLLLKSRFREAFAVAAIAFATLEVGPVMVFFVGLFFVVDRLLSRPSSAASDAPRAGWSERAVAFGRRLRSAAGSPTVRVAALLTVVSLVAYAALRYAEYTALYVYWGGHPTVASSQYIVGTSAVGLTSALPSHVAYTTLFWVVLYALVGFVPWFAPRTLVLVAPWVVYTYWSGYSQFSTIGFQYTFVPAAPIFIGVVYGLDRLDRGTRVRVVRRVWGYFWEPRPATSDAGIDPRRRRGRRSARASWGVVALAALIVANGLAGPMDPLRQRTFGGVPGYSLTYGLAPGYSETQQLVDLLPAHAIVLASDDLFPFVANDVNAYSLLWYAASPNYLPFNATVPPAFVLLADNQVFAVPLWLRPMLYSANDYGLRGMVWSTPIGPVLLFEHGYIGPTDAVGGTPVLSPTAYHGQELRIGDAGALRSDPNATYGQVVQSTGLLLAPVWYGPYVSLPAGSYTVTLLLKAEPVDVAAPPNPLLPILLVNATAFGTPFGVNLYLDYGALDHFGWTSVRFSIYLRLPALNVEVLGFLESPIAVVQLNYAEIVPS
jgi:uncharacterized membrane protein